MFEYHIRICGASLGGANRQVCSDINNVFERASSLQSWSYIMCHKSEIYITLPSAGSQLITHKSNHKTTISLPINLADSKLETGPIIWIFGYVRLSFSGLKNKPQINLNSFGLIWLELGWVINKRKSSKLLLENITRWCDTFQVYNYTIGHFYLY